MNKYFKNEENAIVQNSFIIHPKLGKIQINELKPSEYEESQEFEKIDIKVNNLDFLDSIFFSKKINRYLWDNEMGTMLNTSKNIKVIGLIKEKKVDLLKFLKNRYTYAKKNNKLFYNSEMICLASDLDIENGVAHISKGEYFDNYITNEISSSHLTTIDKSDVLVDGTQMFPLELKSMQSPALASLSNSPLNNLIGACTIAFTNDNYLVIWKQGTFVQQSNNLLVPTGSGSADMKDLDTSSFSQSIRNVVQRELVEESMLDIDPKIIGETKILGFYRWVRRGGLPEFAAITKVYVGISDFKPELMEVSAPKTANKFQVESIDKLKEVASKLLAENQGELSVPLYMNLKFLLQYIEERRDEVERFLYGEV